MSTARQGEQGVSLQQQKAAIERYADSRALKIIDHFEERETAAKRGRPVFSKMLRLLKTGKASGVVIHKIDRSARNLKDWADLGELIDFGIEVHFANESLDLQSRGGRLSADIQAVVAADYVRNLREEAKKGFYGRLKQGILPRPAPVGYLDVGAGKPKTIDPVKGPLVRQAFELYATGKLNLDVLTDEMYRRGLTSKAGRKMDRNRLSEMLNNRFYTGVIVIQKTGQQFVGAHQPLVPSELFAAVQQYLKGRFGRRVQKNSFLYSRLLKCKSCARSLIGEAKKQYLYYRCHTLTCPTTNISEAVLNEYVARLLEPLQFSDREKQEFSKRLLTIASEWDREKRNIVQALQIRLDSISARLQKLTDAYLDDLIDKQTFEERKTALTVERENTKSEIERLESGTSGFYVKRLSEYIGLAERAYLLFKTGNQEEKRQLLRLVTSERVVDQKTPMFMLHPVFQELANRQETSGGGASRAIHRDAQRLINKLEPIVAKETQKLEESVDSG